MKKILVLILIASMASVVVNAEPPKYKIEAKTLPSFDVFIKSKLPDPQRDAFPFIKYNPENGYQFFSVERVPGEEDFVFRLSLDAKGQPKKLLPSEKNFYVNLYHGLRYGGVSRFLKGSSLSESICLTIFFPLMVDEVFNERINYFSSVLFKDSSRSKIPVTGENNGKYWKPGTVCFCDESFQIEWREVTNNKQIVTRREAVNPDLVAKLSEIPGLEEMLPEQYMFYTNQGKGFVRAQLMSKKVEIDGKPYEIPNAIGFDGKTSFVDFELLLDWLFCPMTHERISETGNKFSYSGFRITADDEKEKYSILFITLAPGRIDYIANGESKQFKEKPYIENRFGYSIMVPLKEVCDALKAKVIYRPLDGTILIARFFEN